jgi:hypothetical protein
MQKMQRSDVSEHFSVAKTHESVIPRSVTAQRGELLAMTSFSQVLEKLRNVSEGKIPTTVPSQIYQP